MSSNLNQFGYTTEDAGPLMTPEELLAFTGNVFSASTEQLENVLSAVSEAVRGYCGWHVAPNTLCTWNGDADGVLGRLPARMVTAVSAVSVNGTELSSEEYDWRRSGLIRLRQPVGDDWGQPLHVEFYAGTDPAALAGIVAQVATNALVAPAGVRSEQAGDVSISYNTTTAEGGTGGVRLLASDKEQLDQFRLFY